MKNIKMLACAAFITVSLTSCAVHVQANSKGGDLDSVFGGVTVSQGAEVRDVSSVNGGVELKKNSSARDVETVNGGIDIGSGVRIRSAETVNGGIDGGEGLTVEQSVETVNGGIELDKNTQIGGNVETVNGDIDLNNVKIGKNLKTNNGDITLTNGSEIVGNIIVEASNGWFSGWGNDEKIVIKIDDSSAVRGEIQLHKPVKLEISEKAIVGEIKYLYERK